MDLELGSSVGVDVAILALVPIFWVRMKRWNKIQSKYKKGIAMMGAILLFVHVLLCIREFKKSEYYRKIHQLGLKMIERAALLVFAVIFMVVAKACLRRRKHRSATMIMGAIITLVFVAMFIRKSTMDYVSNMQTSTDSSTSLSTETPVRSTNVFSTDDSYLYKPPMPCMSYKSSPFVSSIIRTKTFDIRKLTTKVFFFLFVSVCASIGI